MKLGAKQEYTVIAFSANRIAACRFRRKGGKYRLAAHAERTPDESGTALRRVLKDIGGASGFVLLTGNLPGGEFFRCPGSSALTAAEQKDALSFELPRRMLRAPDDPCIQFMPAGNGTEELQVYAFPRASLNRVAALMNAGKCKADDFLYPLLGVRAGDPAVYLPDLEPDFIFDRGEWHPAGNTPPPFAPAWTAKLAETFLLPTDFAPESWMSCLLTVRLVTSLEFRRNESAARVLPPQLRPKRLRLHAGIAVILLLALAGLHLRSVVADRMTRYEEYRTLQNERTVCLRKLQKLKDSLKKTEKSRKELQKVLALSAGEPEFLRKLAALSEALPSDVLVSSFRFNDPNVDLMLQTESTNLNLPQTLRPLSYWKIAQLNQRTTNEGVSMVFLRLAPPDDDKEKKEKRP